MADLSDDDRRRFEAWASDDGAWPKAIERDAAGQYKLSITAHSWTVWRAAIAADRAINATQAAPTTGWLCVKCGTDRTKAPCPYGYSAALTGQCPMVGVAQAAPVAPAEPAPPGWQLVPVTPTRPMLMAWVEATAKPDEHPVAAGYRAMLAAAPHPATAGTTDAGGV